MTDKTVLIAAKTSALADPELIEDIVAKRYQVRCLFHDGAGESSSSLIKELLNADLLVCRSWTPEVLYVLGMAHAIGIPSLFVMEETIPPPLDVTDWNLSIIARDRQGWQEELIREIERLIQGRTLSPKPVVARGGKSAPINLSNEIRNNLLKVEEVKAKDLIFLGVWHEVKEGSFPVVTCETDVYESYWAKVALEKLTSELREALETLYEKFYEVNLRSKALSKDFRLETAQAYLKSVRLLENWSQFQGPGIIDELMDMGY